MYFSIIYYFLLGLLLGILCLGLLSLARSWISLGICFLPCFHPTIALNDTPIPPFPQLLLHPALSSFWANTLNVLGT